MECAAKLTATLTASGGLSASIASSGGLTGGLTIAGSIPSYAGATVITPGAEAQVLECGGLLMPENITVQPIPSNYGLITWDGATLTVS